MMGASYIRPRRTVRERMHAYGLWVMGRHRPARMEGRGEAGEGGEVSEKSGEWGGKVGNASRQSHFLFGNYLASKAKFNYSI